MRHRIKREPNTTIGDLKPGDAFTTDSGILYVKTDKPEGSGWYCMEASGGALAVWGLSYEVTLILGSFVEGM